MSSFKGLKTRAGGRKALHLEFTQCLKEYKRISTLNKLCYPEL